ncbi:MAG: hypothetical protein ACLU9S_05330 [Oscillospiraceae bacterium]
MLVTLKSALRLIEAGREQGARLARGSQGLLRVDCWIPWTETRCCPT